MPVAVRWSWRPFATPLFASWAAAAAVEAGAGCLAQYLSDLENWIKLSGALTHVYVHSVTERVQGFDPRDFDTVRMLFESSSEQVLACWQAGGRYWENELIPEPLEHQPEAFAECVSELSGPSQHPPPVRGSICAPSLCEEEDIASTITNVFTYQRLCTWDVQVHATPSIQGATSALELSHWSQLDLDFAVVGADNCGTNSLRLNLQQHPDIGFQHEEDESQEGLLDDFFEDKVQLRTLPPRRLLEDFNGAWHRGGRVRPRVAGYFNGAAFSSPLARQALAQIPNILAVMVVCDPLGRIEKDFMRHHYCGALEDKTVAPSLRSEADPCAESIADVLHMEAWLHQRLMAPHLAEMRILLDRRLLILHQESLRTAPRLTYSGLASILGAKEPFPRDTAFRRYNSLRGHRTDLCHNASLVFLLKEFLHLEYLVLERALQLDGSDVPTELRQRLTRCDRPEELEGCASTVMERTALVCRV